MSEWKPNKDVLDDLLRNLGSLPDKEKVMPYAVTYPKECSIQDMIDDLNNRTERGRKIYERHLEDFYLRARNRL